MLVIRLIKILIDVDYCNIFFKADSKRARWIVCIIVYVAAAFTDIIFDSIFISIIEAFIVIYVIMQVYSGTLDKKILFASMNVALECIADMGTSYILPGSSSIQDVAGNYDIELGYYLPRQFITIMLFYFLVIVVKNIYRTREYSDMSYNWLFFMLLAIVSIGVWYIIVRGLISTEGGMICVGASLLIMNMVSYKLYESVVDAYRYEKENEKLKNRWIYMNVR